MTAPEAPEQIECVMCGGTGYLVDVTGAITEALSNGHQLASVEPEAMGVVFDLARETLRTHDRLADRGWVMNPIPHEAEVRTILRAAQPEPVSA